MLWSNGITREQFMPIVAETKHARILLELGFHKRLPCQRGSMTPTKHSRTYCTLPPDEPFFVTVTGLLPATYVIDEFGQVWVHSTQAIDLSPYGLRERGRRAPAP